MKSAGEIQELITDFDHRHVELFNRMDSDYDLWALKSYSLDRWSDNVTFNEPRVFADSVMQILEAARLSIAIHREDKNNKKEVKVERFAFSAFKSADDRLVARLSPQLKSALIFSGSIRGFMAGRVVVYKRGDDLIMDVLPYDPRFLAYGMDSEGINWSAYTTWRDPGSVEFEYKKKFTAFEQDGVRQKEVKVVDYWDDKTNVVLIGDEIAQKAAHKLERPPVIVIPCGSTPLVVAGTGKYLHISNWGESIFAGGRDLYPQLNKILTIWMSLIAKSQHQGGFVITPDASLKIQGSPYGKDEWMPLPEGTNIHELNPPDIAKTAPQLFDILSQAVQRSDFVWLKYGQLWKGQELSRVAIAELKEGADKILTPLLIAMQKFYTASLRKMTEQYLHTGIDTWNVRGFDSKGREFQDVINPGDVEGNYDATVEFLAITPEQDAENYAKAQIAMQSGLASQQFIREYLVKFQDPKAIENQMLVEQAELLSPKIKLLRIIDALDELGKKEEADVMRIELSKMLEQEMVSAQAPATPEQTPEPASQAPKPPQQPMEVM